MRSRDRFRLTLVTTRDCNLRCSYCYVGPARREEMSDATARRAIDCALNSIVPGGTLELGFFGGEPLLRAAWICGVMEEARELASRRGCDLHSSVTTNGTVRSGAAWRVISEVSALAVSCDGLPEIHDLHRRTADDRGSSHLVTELFSDLVTAGRDFSVVSVIRPETVEYLPAGMLFLRHLGVPRVEPVLDVWAAWDAAAAERLARAVRRAADIWIESVGEFSVSWFEERLARAHGCRPEAEGRCGFGVGELAVLPSGELCRCERLIGRFDEGSPARISGGLSGRRDFLGIEAVPGEGSPGCGACTVASACGAACRCANYVRSGDPSRPDGFLCFFERACLRDLARVIEGTDLVPEAISGGGVR